MKILVTGATGLVGFHLVKTLLESGHVVIAVGRSQSRLSLLERMGAIPLVFDLRNSLDKYKILVEQNASIWIHCAAAVSGADKETLLEVNVEGTHKLIASAPQGTIFYLISSITVYGFGGRFSEEDDLDPKTNYARSKLLAEEIVQSSNLRWTILRLPFVGGPGDQNFLQEISARVKRKSIPFLNGKIAYIDARDLSHFIQELLTINPENEIINIQSQEVKFNDFIRIMGEKMKLEPPYGRKFPYWLLLVIGFTFDFFFKLRGKSNERGISSYRVRSLNSTRVMNISKLVKLCEYQPQYTIEQSITDWLLNVSV